ncbi:glycoside hydrolase family 19 protein [Micromonospora zhanjiangensis]|uniref:Glycoside hydrolase family 19 protein n=1 Tax=Micromonospora zhanjiangensis TaxID=1522057 RepID=A0ABV8KV03_9ACTN
MRVNKLLAAKHAGQSALKPNATNIMLALVGLIGFGPLIALAVVALVVIIAIIAVLGGASSPGGAGNQAGSGATSDMITAMTGDGKGTFAEDRLPRSDVAEPIKAAAKECDLISPAILAAQIEVESGFTPDKVGPNGEQGISQLPPDVFTKYGKDDDNNGRTSALDIADSIHAQARYLCALAKDLKKLLDEKKLTGDLLTLTLFAYRAGLDAVTKSGGGQLVDPQSYPVQVRSRFKKYLTDAPSPGASPTVSDGTPPVVGKKQVVPPGSGLTEARFDAMFPSRNPFYTYDGLVAAMATFPAFAGTGDATVKGQELAAFLANIDHESGGLVYVEEINQSVWGDYCDAGQPYGCPAGKTAYHGRGPIQLSWNTNYKAAGDALGVDLLGNPDQVKNDPTVAWRTALWFWMTRSGAGSMTAHAAITGGAGFGETIRSINGARECNGGNAGQVQSRISSYQRFTAALGVEPGEKLSC